MQALIAQKPADIGAQGVEQAFNALEGKPTTQKIGTESDHHHQGQPRREPGRALQAVLLSRAAGRPRAPRG